MRTDHYARSGPRWALGAELVYRPIAAELVAMSPHSLAGRTVLDAGAGTGAASSALNAQHARALATDLSAGMLAWDAAARPPCAVADIRALPLADGSVDDAVGAFVLNHLTDPCPGSPNSPVSPALVAPFSLPSSATTAAARPATGSTPSPRPRAGRSRPGTPSSKRRRSRSSAAAQAWHPRPARRGSPRSAPRNDPMSASPSLSSWSATVSVTPSSRLARRDRRRARRCARRRRRAGDPRRHAAVPAHSRVPLRPGPS